ncbi:MAG: hypothetical protein MUF21_07955 [Gemmatimonadaceae bacterium]|jgi:hypothetical protein|nr:hypothetical protein [Gemmatimonadaceae bacterium]
MSGARWIAAHAAQPPARLRARLDEVTGSGTDAAAPADALAFAGQELLASILAAGTTARDAALDLLTADALVTYAFEAAADEPALIDRRAAATMRALASLVNGHDAPAS